MLAVALSQSGRTEEIVETLAWAADCGAATVAITNDADSPLAATAELAPVTQAGPEYAVPATKSYTTQLAALVVLALGLGADPSLRTTVHSVPDAVQAMLAADADALVAALSDVDGLMVSGRGFAASTAWELSLKVRETCSIDASGLSYADLLHGPIAVAGPRIPALLVAADEAVTGSTRLKAGTAQRLVPNALSTATMVRRGRTWSNLMVGAVATNSTLRGRVAAALAAANGRGPGHLCRRGRRGRRLRKGGVAHPVGSSTRIARTPCPRQHQRSSQGGSDRPRRPCAYAERVISELPRVRRP